MNTRQDVPAAGAESKIYGPLANAPKILLVADHPVLRPWLARALRAHGYRVTSAPNAFVARLLLDQRAPDLLLTDLRIPRPRHGWELLAYCRTRYPRVPVVLMSSSAAEPPDNHQLSADGFLEKPFTADELLSAVDRVVARWTPTQGSNPAGLPLRGPAG